MIYSAMHTYTIFYCVDTAYSHFGSYSALSEALQEEEELFNNSWHTTEFSYTTWGRIVIRHPNYNVATDAADNVLRAMKRHTWFKECENEG